MTIDQYAFFASICFTVFGAGWFIEHINHRVYQSRYTIPDKIIHIIYETSSALKKSRSLAENVLKYVDDKELALEAQQVINEIDKAEDDN